MIANVLKGTMMALLPGWSGVHFLTYVDNADIYYARPTK